ncbi:DNA polymerase-3 subunit epsilon [Aquiflexum balticum DSM 16537]|uniref:DNA polymerase-3 subunit epsilon n=1 Tax=Aquiflexum balticum DSM 16537 TaxID=758820 RepID=A0A1W2H818_9BACT|nr:3'-5' exonuclease [Aquiflexum balticum]SMD44999.1 DNA polymerase-3 subunit epsilon [Aquiflexum balticum DSM 16537]
MYLFFDTETTGLPKDYKAEITDLDNWPRLVQLAYLIYSPDGKLEIERNYIIKPQNFNIPEEATNIHGITTENALNNGKELGHVLLEFNDFLKSAGYLIAHNLQFDKNVVEAEFLRVKMENSLNQKKQICTMLRTTEYCGLRNHHGSKWPKLSELYFKIFNKNFEGGHDAFEDIKATSKCFWELKKQGVL